MDAPHDATSSVTADTAPPSPQGEGETEPRQPFKNKPTELLYQLLQEATADMAVRIDGAPIKEVCVSVKFDEGGNESGREIYLGF